MTVHMIYHDTFIGFHGAAIVPPWAFMAVSCAFVVTPRQPDGSGGAGSTMGVEGIVIDFHGNAMGFHGDATGFYGLSWYCH